MSDFALLAGSWLLTFLLHSTVWLGGAWLLLRQFPSVTPTVRDWVWKGVFVGSLLSPTLQVGGTSLYGWEGMNQSLVLQPEVAAPQPAVAEITADVFVPSETAQALTLQFTPEEPLVEGDVAMFAIKDAPMVLGTSVRDRSSLPATTVREWPETPIQANIEQPATAAPEESLPLWLQGLLGLWAVGATVGLIRWVAALMGLRRQLRGRMELTTGALVKTIQKDLARFGTHRANRIRFSVSDRIQVPVAFGLFRGEVCLPVRALRELDSAQQQTMLGHELAHLLRRDPVWLAAFHLTQRILFFQPLLWLARREALIAAEELCDAWAIHRSGHRVALAECLTTVAQWMRPGQADLPVACMARPGSPLGRRVERLLDRSAVIGPAHRAVRGSIAFGLVSLLAAMAVFAPGFASRWTEAPPAVEENVTTITSASLMADWNLAQQRIRFLHFEIDALREELDLALPGEATADDLRQTLSRLELQLQRLEQLSDRIRWNLSTQITS
ncbi:MAG: M56 family metallopeptidase [Planctomycetota bacterium]